MLPRFPATMQSAATAFLVARCLDRLADPGYAEWLQAPANQNAVSMHPSWSVILNEDFVPDVIAMGREHLRRTHGGR